MASEHKVVGGVTRLRLNTGDGSIQMGSGEVVSSRAPEGTSWGGYSDADLHGVEPFNAYQDFVDATKTDSYKGGVFNAREAEAYRELCAKRLAKMEQMKSNWQERSEALADPAERITQMDGNIPLPVAQAAVQTGPFATREDRARHYADPRYSKSEDFRNYVASRDAITEAF